MYNYTPDNGLRPIEIEMLRTEIRSRPAVTEPQSYQPVQKHPLNAPGSVLTVYTGNEWLAQQRNTATPRRLFGNFWYENELCILFADTNMGKSILAVQIGNSLANAQPIYPFETDVHDPMKVLYIDFELSAKQFELRYTDPQNPDLQAFGSGFYRAEFDPVTASSRTSNNELSYDRLLNSAIDHAIDPTDARILIIDNLTSLTNGTQKAIDALHIIRSLRMLKYRHKLSVLVLAHTPKRNPAKPLTRNDLQGSKMLINFADSAFAIGESHTQPHTRYLKQIKQRSTHELYGEHNVCLCRITKNNSFLSYEFTGHATEREHLGKNEHLKTRIQELHTQGLSQRQIATALHVSVGTVNRVLQAGKEYSGGRE